MKRIFFNLILGTAISMANPLCAMEENNETKDIIGSYVLKAYYDSTPSENLKNDIATLRNVITEYIVDPQKKEDAFKSAIDQLVINNGAKSVFKAYYLAKSEAGEETKELKVLREVLDSWKKHRDLHKGTIDQTIIALAEKDVIDSHVLKAYYDSEPTDVVKNNIGLVREAITKYIVDPQKKEDTAKSTIDKFVKFNGAKSIFKGYCLERSKTVEEVERTKEAIETLRKFIRIDQHTDKP